MAMSEDELCVGWEGWGGRRRQARPLTGMQAGLSAVRWDIAPAPVGKAVGGQAQAQKSKIRL